MYQLAMWDYNYVVGDSHFIYKLDILPNAIVTMLYHANVNSQTTNLFFHNIAKHMHNS